MIAKLFSSPFPLFIAGCLLVSPDLRGDATIASVFGDNMVLQRNQENSVWGKADPGEVVTVTFAGVSVKGTADPEGRWKATLPALSVRRVGEDFAVRGTSGEEQVLSNVVVGEVWFFCGPSNILWSVRACDNPKEEVANANYPEIRFFKTGRKLADVPQEDCEGEWTVCSPRTVGVASGVAYFFSRKIHLDADVPVGAMQSFWSSSRVEGWTSESSVRGVPELNPIVDWWDKAVDGFDAVASEERYAMAMKKWEAEAATAKTGGKPEPAKPRKAQSPAKSTHKPGRLFNGMVNPLIPYGIRGAVTYQGLGNLYWAEHGKALTSSMFKDWRERWGQGAFPIGMIQPAPFDCSRYGKQNADAYAWQRENQLLILEELPNMGLAPTMDLGEIDEIHFRNKQDVGKRMALWALAEVYGQKVAFAGPVYDSMKIEGNRIRVRFKNSGEGLMTSDKKSPSEFVIAGADGKFFPADGIIEGDSVFLQSEKVPHPKAVRFAWSDTAISNLINSDGLPASIFRSDSPKKQ